MSGAKLVTVLRGLKVRVSTMNAFLIANDLPHGIDGFSFVPFCDSGSPDEIYALLHAKVGSDEILYVVPGVSPDPAPEGILRLRQDILKYGEDDDEGLLGLFVIYTERLGPNPSELEERYKEPINCDRCSETVDYWPNKQWHRNQVHGLDEPLNALPENA
ncbi:hypothetical protein Daus18300_002415 [Diaporthe australafricana]|uniref:C2H2-type domain-containing protein n=1 Tax=Diaporthe australafricana TaxID=127596 RepID=A0ABR3XPA8_9PEZI